MISVSILALKNASLASIADAKDLFSMVNEILKQSGKPAVFDIALVGLWNTIKLNGGSFSINSDLLLQDVSQTNLIIIPSLSGDMIRGTYLNKDYVTWISQQYKNGAEVASLGVGVFLLAYSGLLKNKQCTTHWMYANDFRHFYPAVKLTEEKLFTGENGLYSSGGGSSYWNLLLYLVEKYTNRQTAIQAAKYFVIDFDRQRQSPFVVFRGLKTHEDQIIKNAQEYIEQNYHERLNVDELANKFHLTRRTFERRFKKATRITVADYVQKVKIEASKKHLETGRKSIREVMLEVGYSDTQTFREIFKKITGVTPVEYRNKYSK